MIWDIVMILGASIILMLLLAIAYMFIVFVWRSIIGKSAEGLFETRKKRITVYIICYLLSISYITMKEYWGTNTIGSFFSKDNFEAQYYVQLFPEDSKSKNYLVPADISKNEYGIGVDRVYWPNGGYTDFGNYDNNNCKELYKEGSTTLKDNQGRYWKIVLTRRKIK